MSGSPGMWAGSPRHVRRRPSTFIDGNDTPNYMSLDEFADLEESVTAIERKPSADEFSRIVNELSTSRRLVNASKSSLHRRSFQSLTNSEDCSSIGRLSNAEDDASITSASRTLCCCGQIHCESSKRFKQQIGELESDLRLSAEIGQALLKRQDAIVNKAQQEADEHAQQRDQILSRLTQSIKENQSMERQLSQSTFNLEAADRSHHALLTELAEVRQQLKQVKTLRLKSVNLETKLDYATSELEDLRHELDAERQRARTAECRSEQVMSKQCDALNNLLDGANEDLAATTSWESECDRLVALVPSEEATIHSMLDEYGTVCAENAKLRNLFDSTRKEIKRLRRLSKARTDLEMRDDLPNPEHVGTDESYVDPGHPRETSRQPESSTPAHEACGLPAGMSSATVSSDGTPRLVSSSSRSERYSDERPSEGTSITTASLHSRVLLEDKLSNDAQSTRTFGSERESDIPSDQRTELLASLLEFAQRTYTKLAHADIDTLSSRLQRQKLAGDVGHLARTTVQASVRDIEGLREHFRRQIEREARQQENRPGDTSDTSLVSRRDFFALIKFMRETLLEMACLRRAVNEVHLNPSHAAHILHEQLNASLNYAPKGSWITRMLTSALSSSESTSPHPSPAPGISQDTKTSSLSALTPTPKTPVAAYKRPHAVPIHMMPRASAAKPAPVSIQACGSQIPIAGSHFPKGSERGYKPHASVLSQPPHVRDRSGSRLTRVMDDDQVSLRYGDLVDSTRSIRLRARGLSDSSIHSTFLEHGEREAPMDREITAATLTLGSDL